MKEETVIYFSRKKSGKSILLLTPFSLSGIFFFFFADEKVLGVFMFLFFGFLCGIFIREWLNRKPQLIISSKAIINANNNLFAWTEMSNIRITLESGRYSNLYYLEFSHLKGKERWLLDGLELNHDEIEDLLHLYRLDGHHEKSYKDV